MNEPHSKFFSRILIFILIAGGGILLFSQRVTQKSSQLESVNPTANWQTYRNEQYGFEFRYPSNWKVENCGDDILINGHCDTDAAYVGYIHISTGSLDEQLQLFANFEKSDTTIAGINAVKINSVAYNPGGPGLLNGSKQQSIFFSKDNLVFEIELVEPPNQNYAEVFSQILSTFKFIK